MITRIILGLLFLVPAYLGAQPVEKYWNKNTQLVPWRLPLPQKAIVKQDDLDKDGDPDLIRSFINDSIPLIWIDDDDDMKPSDLEGDQDGDCLCIDLNKDGKFAGPNDLCIDWSDTDKDAIANIQLIVQNGGLKTRNYFDWSADFMYIFDWGEKDGIKNFINWNDLILRAWDHTGHSNFFTDYHGNTLFLKMHGSTFRINDLRYNWENPFIFYDADKDNLSEMAIRLVDTPHFRPKQGEPVNPEFEALDAEYDIKFTQQIDYAALAWDLDNDNGQGNEFDFDMSVKFSGKGFDYSDQVHKFKNMRGLPEVYQKLNNNQVVDFCPSQDLISSIDTKMVAAAANTGDPVALEIIQISAEHLGQALSTLIDILNPECIVIGSIYARNEMLFKPIIERVLKQEAIPASLEVCSIKPAGLGESIGDFAALCVAVYEDKF